MRFKAIFKYIGYILIFNALFMFISALISIVLAEFSWKALSISGGICLAVGLTAKLGVEDIQEINIKEGIAISVFGWLITCIIGALPYILHGGEVFDIATSVFESVSGYTTTGASAINDVEALPKGLLFWRASTHFIGGVGIILFVLAVVPNARGARSSIYRSEISELSRLNFHTQTHKIAYITISIYVVMAAISTVLLWLCGMPLFDAVCHAFAAISTGGFSTKNIGIALYNNFAIEVVLMFFMLLGGMHFGLIYATWKRESHNLFSSRLVRAFFLTLIIGASIIALQLFSEGMYSSIEAFRKATFQVVSLVTTTGFATDNTTKWPWLSIVILIYFSIQTSMVGSTTGGIKFDRIYLFFKTLVNQVKQTIHPNAIFVSRIDGVPINNEVELRSLVYIVVYMLLLLFSTLVLTLFDFDGLTSFSTSVAMVGNVGPGFGQIGSMDNFSSISSLSKYFLSFMMLLGRLEIINIFALVVMLAHRRN